jgi:hypothetical protein
VTLRRGDRVSASEWCLLEALDLPGRSASVGAAVPVLLGPYSISILRENRIRHEQKAGNSAHEQDNAQPDRFSLSRSTSAASAFKSNVSRTPAPFRVVGVGVYRRLEHLPRARREAESRAPHTPIRGLRGGDNNGAEMFLVPLADLKEWSVRL